MPPVFGPVSPSPMRLWSCAPMHRQHVVPSVSAKSETSSPSMNSSTSTSAPAEPKHCRLEHGIDRRIGLGDAHRDDHAFAGRDAGGLHHDGRAEPADLRPWRVRLR
jgi:hypothetical protein